MGGFNIHVAQAGTLVICYCAQLTPTYQCSGTWFYGGLLQISGPKGGQSWVMPTKVNCASNSTGVCSTAGQEELVNIDVANNLDSGVHLASILIESESSSILTFMAPVAELLQDGDAIFLEPSSILIDNKPLSSMTEAEQFAAMSLAGMSQFQDDTSKTFLKHWHYVQLLTAEDGSREATSKVRIPIGWSSTDIGIPSFSFVPGQLQWFRSNILSSQNSLKADRLVTDLPVCWAPNEGTGIYNFYGTAGSVSFTDPSVLVGARLALSTRRSGSRAPILISFSPSRSIGEYERTMGQTLVTLRFLNTSLQPAMASQNFSQASCGHLFSELWSNAEGGFPIPHGCWLNDAGANGEPGQRELYILFGRINGLRNKCPGTSCTYQLVLDAIATDLVVQPILDIDVSCSFPHGGCARRHQIYERATIAPEAGTLGAADLVSSVSLPDAGDDGVLHWNNVLTIRLTTMLGASKLAWAETSPIQQGQYVRLFMTPFTQWSFASGCSASCTAEPGTCSATCTVERLLPSVFASELETCRVFVHELCVFS
eukprot:symbB.v1.2.007478.t1/scaffold410.1/size210127/5